MTDILDNLITERLLEVRERIVRAAESAGRDPAGVRLLAVTKRHPPETAAAAFRTGLADLGENYVQEARDKAQALSSLPIRWHLIGRLQKNKAKYAPRLFSMVHTVDSLELAAELDRHCAKHGVTLPVLLQVNVAGEEQKAGVAPEDLFALARGAAALKNLAARGLMTMPPFDLEPEAARPFFRCLRELAQEVRDLSLPGVAMDELSMGMSGDLETAVEEGATIVRVGAALFGERT